MKLLVISHKECWRVGGQVVTTGGFPAQITAIAALFDQTTVIGTLRRQPPLGSTQPLTRPGLVAEPLPEPPARGIWRKALLPWWLLRHLPTLWRAIGRADAVHALVPGDVGGLGIVLARLRQRRLFVRHCGTWNHQQTLADRFLAWFLPRIAGGDTVVLATGGGAGPPAPSQPEIEWIFATTLTEAELSALPCRPRWPREAPRLVTVGRLTRGKNAQAIIEALPLIRERYPGASLEVVGDGPARDEMAALVSALGLEAAVRFAGNLDHARVLETLSQCHLFVFPTRVAEGFPKAVLEAMACSLPVVATAVSVVPTLLGSGAGVLLDDAPSRGTDSASVARACLLVLEDESSYRSMAEAAHATAQHYSLERWQGQIGARLERAWGPLRSSGMPKQSSAEFASAD